MFWKHTCSIIMVNMLPTNLGCFYCWNRLPESSGMQQQAMTINQLIYVEAEVQGQLIEFRSLWILFPFHATADCRVSTWGYSLSYVYATHHILKCLRDSAFCMRYLGRFGEEVLQVSQFPSAHVYGFHIPPCTRKCKRAHNAFFLLIKTKQQCQEKSNCFGCKNNVMLLPMQHQSMFSFYLYLKVKEHLQAP